MPTEVDTGLGRTGLLHDRVTLRDALRWTQGVAHPGGGGWTQAA